MAVSGGTSHVWYLFKYPKFLERRLALIRSQSNNYWQFESLQLLQHVRCYNCAD